MVFIKENAEKRTKNSIFYNTNIILLYSNTESQHLFFKGIAGFKADVFVFRRKKKFNSGISADYIVICFLLLLECRGLRIPRPLQAVRQLPSVITNSFFLYFKALDTLFFPCFILKLNCRAASSGWNKLQAI